MSRAKKNLYKNRETKHAMLSRPKKTYTKKKHVSRSEKGPRGSAHKPSRPRQARNAPDIKVNSWPNSGNRILYDYTYNIYQRKKNENKNKKTENHERNDERQSR